MVLWKDGITKTWFVDGPRLGDGSARLILGSPPPRKNVTTGQPTHFPIESDIKRGYRILPEKVGRRAPLESEGIFILFGRIPRIFVLGFA